jgi:hypothetical protein
MRKPGSDSGILAAGAGRRSAGWHCLSEVSKSADGDTPNRPTLSGFDALHPFNSWLVQVVETVKQRGFERRGAA